MARMQLYVKRRGSDEFIVNPRLLEKPIWAIPATWRETVQRAKWAAVQDVPKELIIEAFDVLNESAEESGLDAMYSIYDPFEAKFKEHGGRRLLELKLYGHEVYFSIETLASGGIMVAGLFHFDEVAA